MSQTVTPVTSVTFDYQEWRERYPEFAGVTQGLAQRYFNEACVLCDNTQFSPVLDLNQRGIYLDMLTAHVAALSGGLTGCGTNTPGSGVGLVGRIQSASEGSVSVSVAALGDGDGPNAAWYNQTPYGAMYWTATAQYRTWRTYIGPQPFPEAYNYFGTRLGAWLPW